MADIREKLYVVGAGLYALMVAAVSAGLIAFLAFLCWVWMALTKPSPLDSMLCRVAFGLFSAGAVVLTFGLVFLNLFRASKGGAEKQI